MPTICYYILLISDMQAFESMRGALTPTTIQSPGSRTLQPGIPSNVDMSDQFQIINAFVLYYFEQGHFSFHWVLTAFALFQCRQSL